jgi:tetratricopeptide (TPR) repeat protein
LDTQDGYWRFAHDKLREYILDQLTPSDSADLHGRVAEAIEQVYGDDTDSYALSLAQHWAAAANHLKEGHHSWIAAKQLVEASDFRTAQNLIQRAIELNAYENTDNPTQILAEMHQNMGRTCYGLGDYPQAGEWYRSALDLFREVGDQHGVAKTIGSLSELDFRQGKYQQSKPLAEQSLALSRELDDRKQVGYSLMSLGVIAANDGDLLEAKGLFEECLACMQEIGEPILIARALNNLAIANDLLGDLPQAKLMHTQALAIRRRINDRHGIAYSLNNLANLAEIEGNYANAQRWGLESLAILRGIGEKMSVASAYGLLGKVALKTKDYVAAEDYYQDSLALRRELGDVDGTSNSLCDLGDVARERGDFETAWRYYQQSLQGAIDASLEKRAVGTLIQIARLKNELQEPESALELLLFAQQFNQNLHVPTDDFDPLIAELRALLPAEILDEIEAQREKETLDTIVRKLPN